MGIVHHPGYKIPFVWWNFYTIIPVTFTANGPPHRYNTMLIIRRSIETKDIGESDKKSERSHDIFPSKPNADGYPIRTFSNIKRAGPGLWDGEFVTNPVFSSDMKAISKWCCNTYGISCYINVSDIEMWLEFGGIEADIIFFWIWVRYLDQKVWKKSIFVEVCLSIYVSLNLAIIGPGN